MTKSYSMDLRERVVSAVDAEGMSRHEAAARFGIAVHPFSGTGGLRYSSKGYDVTRQSLLYVEDCDKRTVTMFLLDEYKPCFNQFFQAPMFHPSADTEVGKNFVTEFDGVRPFHSDQIPKHHP